jgi:1-acyl-sn-glycerol-3-phosphate acyltransferase
VALAALWLVSLGGRREAWLGEATWRLQQLWAGALFGAARALFRIRVEVSGDGEVEPGPVLVLLRHASIVDTLLPANLIARPHGIHLRYVLKRELLSDPCLDVAGRRLPNYFVRRGTGEAREVERVRALAEGLGAEDGVLIYPEGTRFTPARRERALARIAARRGRARRGRRSPPAPRPAGHRLGPAADRLPRSPQPRQGRGLPLRGDASPPRRELAAA